MSHYRDSASRDAHDRDFSESLELVNRLLGFFQDFSLRTDSSLESSDESMSSSSEDDDASWDDFRRVIDLHSLGSFRRSSVPCKFYLMGRCNRLGCRFSHQCTVPSSPSRPSTSTQSLSSGSSSATTATTSARETDSTLATPIAGTSHSTTLPQTSSKACKFFQIGACFKGENCHYSHAIEIVRPDKKDEPVMDYECAICYENITEKKRRFGILTGCDHMFCLECIRTWRRNYDLDTSVIRACPICRKPSHYVIPSDHFVEGQDKTELENNYKNQLKLISCKYYDGGKGTCPFGHSCFYLHDKIND